MTTQAAGLAKQTAHGGPDAQISDHDDIICGGQHADLAVHTAAPDAGWRVEPNTVNWAVSAYQGNPHWGANCSTLTTACLCLDTEHHGAGTSDKVWFTITFTEDKGHHDRHGLSA